MNVFPRSLCLLATFLLVSLGKGQELPAQTRAPQEVVAEVRRQLESEPEVIKKWYAGRNFEPVWKAEYLEGLTEFIAGLDRHGLYPELFHLEGWSRSWQGQSPSAAAAARLEITTTRLALYAVQSLAYGFVDPLTVHAKWEAIPRTVTPAAMLNEALKQGPGNFARWLDTEAPPRDPRYRELVTTLARYREIARQGGWKALPPPPKAIGPGDPYSDIPLLRARLQAEGDLASGGPKSRFKVIDPETAVGLKSYQFRHGIEPDAVIGPQTLTELNHPISHRLESLIINLDRLRWMPRDYETTPHLEVNIAENALRLFSGGQSLDTMRVIVGIKGLHQTPVFHGRMRYLYFRPYWNVPLTIARNEVVPAALKDPGYVAAGNYEVVPSYGVTPDKVLPATPENLAKVAAGDLNIRQGTGSQNALGLVKFIFPNDNSVYLHDTPNHDLFKATDRDFSHGCVRVSRPDELADFVLKPNGDWNLGTIQTAMRDAKQPNRKVDLKSPIPVYLIYWTSTIMDDGRVRFDQDIYGHDAEMLRQFGLREAIAEPPALPRP